MDVCFENSLLLWQYYDRYLGSMNWIVDYYLKYDLNAFVFQNWNTIYYKDLSRIPGVRKQQHTLLVLYLKGFNKLKLLFPKF